MKNKITLICILFFTLSKVEAQINPPIVSSQENPIWYYIQVVGEGSSREDRVFVAKGGTVYGEELNTQSDAQLFRLESTVNGKYRIVSKSTNKRIDVGMVDSEESLTLSNDGIDFTIDVLEKYYYNITATVTATGGSSDKKWAHQSNSASSYKIILVSTTWSGGANSQFTFIPYESVNLLQSENNLSVWYRIENCNYDNLPKKYITDKSQDSAIENQLSLNEIDTENDEQLWKIESKGNSVWLRNKQTNNIIEPFTDIDIDNSIYNKVSLSANVAPENGWTLKHIKAGQHTISVVEQDNITRYLSLTKQGEEATEHNLDNVMFSNSVWRFTKVSSETASIVPDSNRDKINISVKNGMVIVEGVDEYMIFNTHGMILPNNSSLQQGSYIIKYEGGSKKISIK